MKTSFDSPFPHISGGGHDQISITVFFFPGKICFRREGSGRAGVVIVVNSIFFFFLYFFLTLFSSYFFFKKKKEKEEKNKIRKTERWSFNLQKKKKKKKKMKMKRKGVTQIF